MRSLALAFCVLAIGCGSGNGGGGGSGGTGGGGAGGGGGGGAGGGGGGGAMVAVHGTVTDSGGMGGGTGNVPLSGATVTIAGTTTSTTTAADGTFTLNAAAGSTIFLKAALANYQTTGVGFVVPAAGGTVGQFQMLRNADVMAVTSALSPMLTVDTAKGDIIVQFSDPAMTAGYSATISASHDNTFTPDSNPPAYGSTTTGGHDNQALVFPNVAVGTTTVTVTPATGKTCTPAQAITDWRVDADVFMFIYYNCQ